MKRVLVVVAGWVAAWLVSRPAELARPGVDAALLEVDSVSAGAAFLGLTPRKGRGPDIAIIVVSGARKDRVAATMPNLVAWSEGARSFTDVRADATHPLTAAASLLTGLPAADHGAGPLPGKRLGSPVPRAVPTLATRLQREGWRTVGVVADRAWHQRAFGLAQGFDVWLGQQLEPGETVHLDGERVTQLALAALRQREPGEATFLYVNYMDAHPPWTLRAGYVSDEDIDDDVLPGAQGWVAARARLAAGDLPARVERSWSEAADAGHRYADHQLGVLLPGLADFEFVAVLSTHGVSLGERGQVGVGGEPFAEVTELPLYVRGLEPGADARPFQPRHVAAMVLAQAGLGAPPEPEAPKVFVGGGAAGAETEERPMLAPFVALGYIARP